jgi:hypothetical protein
MTRHAHGQAVEARAGEERDRAIPPTRQHQGQRPRPKRSGQQIGASIERHLSTRAIGVRKCTISGLSAVFLGFESGRPRDR